MSTNPRPVLLRQELDYHFLPEAEAARESRFRKQNGSIYGMRLIFRILQVHSIEHTVLELLEGRLP